MNLNKILNMKTRNIFAALAFGLFATVALTTVGCTEQKTTPGKDIPGKEIHDTIKTTDTIGHFNITKITAEAAGDRMEVEFTPDAEWAFASTAEWLVVVTERGTKTDRTLVFNVAENTEPVARVANTILTVGGVKYPLTINQKAALPLIKVYGAVTNFSDNNTVIEISNIVSNLDIEVATVPEWVKKETAIVEKNDYGFWVVTAELIPAKYDTEVRRGDIVIKDKNSDVKATIAVVCDPSTTGFFLNSNDDFSVPFPGLSLAEGDMVRKITIAQLPDAENLADPYVPVVRFSTTKGDASDRGAPYVIIDEVVPAGVSAHAAYATKEYTVSVDTYIAGSAQAAAIFIVRQSELNTFKVAEKTRSLLVIQEPGKLAEVPATTSASFDFLSTADGEATFSVTVFDKSGEFTIASNGGTKNESNPILDTRFRGTLTEVSKVSPSVLKGTGWTDYVYKAVCTKAQNNTYGLPNSAALPSYVIRLEFADHGTNYVNLGNIAYTNYATGKLKNTTDKFNFATWNAADIEADNQVTVLYRSVATEAGMLVGYSSMLSNSILVEKVSFQATDDDGDGYVEVVYKAKTKAAIANPSSLNNPTINIVHAPLASYSTYGASIPVRFVAVP